MIWFVKQLFLTCSGTPVRLPRSQGGKFLTSVLFSQQFDQTYDGKTPKVIYHHLSYGNCICFKQQNVLRILRTLFWEFEVAETVADFGAVACQESADWGGCWPNVPAQMSRMVFRMVFRMVKPWKCRTSRELEFVWLRQQKLVFQIYWVSTANVYVSSNAKLVM